MQYNQLAQLCNSVPVSTPPLSLSSATQHQRDNIDEQPDVDQIIEQRADDDSKVAASKIRSASRALTALREDIRRTKARDSGKLSSKRSGIEEAPPTKAVPVLPASSLEQDFTIEGVPSKLGCPFASMANKDLSSHAASVLSRYNTASTPTSTVNRINGIESLAKRRSHRQSFADPIKAEICGFSDHDQESPYSERALKDHLEQPENAEVGVCPIRFLDQHSPEEVATYFEKHKHELPRSHELCVKRYQSNEQQIRKLDAQYGNLVTMIQGLGAKHQDLLPQEPDDDAEPEQEMKDVKSAEKVQKWANTVSAQAVLVKDEEDDEERQAHFERPLREIRVGESPSRPWGLHVPPKYLEHVDGKTGDQSVIAEQDTREAANTDTRPGLEGRKSAKCPFDIDKDRRAPLQNARVLEEQPQATANVNEKHTPMAHSTKAQNDLTNDTGRMVFTGPVFIGYSAEDAAKILRMSKPDS